MQQGSLEPFEELDDDMMILCMSFDGIFDWLELASSMARRWNPTPPEVYLSESGRRLGSAIDDREVPGVMTEFVQRETDTLKKHHQQVEEAQLASYEANVCERQSCGPKS